MIDKFAMKKKLSFGSKNVAWSIVGLDFNMTDLASFYQKPPWPSTSCNT